jgi:hypothetical protein
MDGKELSAAEFFALMRSEEKAGDEEYRRLSMAGKPLVLVGGVVWVDEETAREIAA